MGNSLDSGKKWLDGKEVTRRDFLKTALATTGAILVGGCAPSTTPQPTSPAAGAPPAAIPTSPRPTLAPTAVASAIRRGGALICGQQNDWEGFDPHRQTSTANAFPEIYNCLVQLAVQPDGSLVPAPDLATSWELKEDTAIFKLRQGVKFHDGSDWNATVAKYNIDRLKDAKSTAQAFVESIKSAEVVDPYTLKLNLTGPAGSLLANLSRSADGRTYMISMEMAQKAGDRYGLSPETTAGTGPMKLVEWVSGSHHVVQRTGHYWENGVDGQPLTYLETIRIRFMADDSIRATELRAGSVHVVNNLAPKDIISLQNDPNVAVVENPFQWAQYQFTFSTKSELFKDNLKLRQAVQYAINREAIAKVIGQGIGAPQYFFLAPGYLGYDETLPHYEYDPQRAKQLLADAGYPNGVQFTLSVINRPIDLQQAQMLEQILAEVGITVKLDVLERIAWTEKMASLNYDMSTYFTSMRPDPDTILAGRFQSGQGKNYAGMADETMDELLDKGRKSYDEKVRAAAYADVQRRIYETAWYGTIWYKKYFDGYSKKVKGVTPTQDPYWDLRQAWLDV